LDGDILSLSLSDQLALCSSIAELIARSGVPSSSISTCSLSEGSIVAVIVFNEDVTEEEAASVVRALQAVPVSIPVGTSGVTLQLLSATTDVYVGGTKSPTAAVNSGSGSESGGSSDSGNLSDTEIALLVILVVLAVALIIIAIACLRARRRPRSSSSDVNGSGGKNQDDEDDDGFAVVVNSRRVEPPAKVGTGRASTTYIVEETRYYANPWYAQHSQNSSV
jgi:hypothetical protein